MKSVLIFGATGRTGRHLCRLAGAAGYRPIAAGRDPRLMASLPGSPLCVAADLLLPDTVESALRSTSPDAVISVVGGRGTIAVDGEGVMTMIESCRRADVRRVLIATSLGCGDSRDHASPALLNAIGSVLDAKTRAERHLTATGLDWTIVRPGGLLDQEPNGKGALYDDPRVHGRITCGDLAALMTGLIDQRSSIRRVLSAVDTLTVSGPEDRRLFVIGDDVCLV
ncbi:MAG: SDR family oxidoreductase [Hyphomicrobiales bacterium]|nr:SDR family oxidoreductase [Hyphomicrobiales bacterium]